MSTLITRVEIRYEQDVVYARHWARLIAELLGIDRQDQARVSTAVSEIARNAVQYAGGGTVEFLLEGGPPRSLAAIVRDHGPGFADLDAVLDGRHGSSIGTGMGIRGARRLMDTFRVETSPATGTTVFLAKALPATAPAVTPSLLRRIADELASAVVTPLDEARLQNQELMQALDEVRTRQEERVRLSGELEDTNRGVVALYAELDEKALQLAHANELKGRFLSNMSHEFRTPLNAILALSRLLLDRTDGDLTEEQEKQVVFVRTAAQDLSELVNDLLDLARIEAGKVVVKARDCTVEELFSGLRGMLRPMLAAESLELVFKEPEGIPGLHTDDGKVAQILRNFLSNALKFAPQAEVRVSVRLDDDRRSVVFAVADTGIGIAAADLERVFEEYAQVEAAQARLRTGTGLGLPISRKLAELLGGSVWVESELGVGSTFFARIPVSYGGAAGSADASAPGGADVTRLRTLREAPGSLPIEKILIIDDEQVARYVLKGFLAGTKYTVIEAVDGAQGLRMARQELPILIVLDLVMPGMSGFEVLAKLKADPATVDIPVIIATSMVLDQEERQVLLRSALDVLSKESLSREGAVLKVRQALEQAAGRRQEQSTQSGEPTGGGGAG